MNPILWLEQNAPGFDVLSQQERDAITHFALLWSFFEARALSTRGSSHAILALTHKWLAQDRLATEPFSESLQYFQQRYYANGVETDYLHGLNLRPNDCRDLIYAVLKGENTNPADCVAALLIVVYRLRNNLFHGAKWAYGIQGQLSNFTHANATLMNALSIVGLP
ncbi:acetylglutamate kinase [Novimethylophilus kurashikiensis]|uniref:Acetylglutamate kinase n=1 Tax=Novimethylophilus kurashikiensis TaxID=1825523 RepID=A0A2R5FII6_9PROT|nr:hypothetical protein [Novimethylophilus kurashikiensis]GBG15714.1 acetylglutamate kinase [Novimethylophilus kurashikiensis]